VPVVCHVHAADAKTYFQFGHYLVAVAQGVRRHLVSQGVADSKIPVLYYGVDLEKYANPLPQTEARVNLGVAPEAPVIGVIASLQERKGHAFLLRAVGQIAPRTGPVTVLFAGEGPEEAALRDLARELGLAQQVHFLGFTDDVRAVISACDIIALPSRKEGLSIAVMEAMALGKAVVATDIAGMPELINPGVSGLLVPPFETNPLAEALEKLISDPELRHRLAKQGQEFVRERFDQRQCLALCADFLEKVRSAWRVGKRIDGKECRPRPNA
jgi:glycosyltransferase involved in cell wall biosynthesis